MNTIVNLYSVQKGEIQRFLSLFYGNNDSFSIDNDLKWKKNYENPIEIADIIGTFIDNDDKFNINMWISLDKDAFINVTPSNSDKIIRYLFERYPY